MKNALLLLVTTGILFSCGKDDPIIPNQEELITTLIYTLTPSSGGDDVIFKFKDIDGDGGNDPVITNNTLKPNTMYTASIRLLDESTSETEEITDEVDAEREDHQFFFSAENGLNLTISYDDTDTNSNPVGLDSKVETTDASSGKLQVILRHEPDKSATGVANGDITNAGGETDIEVEFTVVIQ